MNAHLQFTLAPFFLPTWNVLTVVVDTRCFKMNKESLICIFETNWKKFKFRELVSRIFWGIFYIEPDLCKVDFCCKADPHLSLTIVFVTKDVGTRNRDSCPLLLRFLREGRSCGSCRVVLDALKFPLVFNLLQQQIKCRMTGSFSKKMWHVIQ